eukprot:5938821-Amphidinium_carterae.1
MQQALKKASACKHHHDDADNGNMQGCTLIAPPINALMTGREACCKETETERGERSTVWFKTSPQQCWSLLHMLQEKSITAVYRDEMVLWDPRIRSLCDGLAEHDVFAPSCGHHS